MYRKVEGSPLITECEASKKYPDDYILFQSDGRKMIDPTGYVRFVGDDDDELFSLQVKLPVRGGVVLEGYNIGSRISLGGIVVGT
ncbi:MAG: hypothetical protein FWB88_09160 [Defluviitaleaceae bacterium]|nr:hypothetical protein [Defluviitaleaceae bacterium]MCL2239554.1 hypothetical protein [Defluviitaleaceae bacterium]